MSKYTRRIQFTGNSTFIVSLPKKWVITNNLRPGDQVIIEDKITHLLIKPSKTPGESQRRTAIIELSQNTLPESVARIVIASYLMGYDEVIIVSGNTPIAPLIRNSIRRTILEKLPGTEIVYEDQHRMEMRILLGTHGITIDETFKRLGKVVESILEDSCTMLSRGDLSVIDEIAKEDDSVDRVYFYLVRLLNKAASGELEPSGTSLQDLLMFRSASKLLERIGDHAVYIALNTKEISNRRDVLRQLGELCHVSLDLYRQSLISFVGNDPWSIDTVSERVNTLKSSEQMLFNQSIGYLNPPELASLRVILESIRRVAEYSRDLAELALNRGLEKILAGAKKTEI